MPSDTAGNVSLTTRQTEVQSYRREVTLPSTTQQTRRPAIATSLSLPRGGHTGENNQRMKRLLFFVGWCVMALQAVAQMNSADSTHRMSEVVVTDRLPLREIIRPQTLGGEELRRMNSNTIADAIRYFSGLQLKDYGGVGGIKTVDIRSMGSNHLGIFYDGIELGNAQNGQIDLGQFSLDNIDEITLYNGQKSAIFQPASDFGNAGSVYIRTHRPQFNDGKDYNLKFKVKYGSSNTIRVSSLWEQRLTYNVSSSLNAEFLNSDGKYKFRYKRVTPSGELAYDTTATRRNGDIHAERVELNFHGTIDRGYWNAKGYMYNSERGIPGAIVNNVWRSGERQNDFNTFVQGRFEKDINDRFSTQWLAKYAYYRTHYINRDTTQLPVDNRYWQQEAYLSTANVYEIMRNWSISASYDFRWNKLNADTYRFAFPTRLSNLVSLATALDTRYFKAQASVMGSFIHDHVRNRTFTDDGKRNFTKLTPAIFVTFPIIPDNKNGSIQPGLGKVQWLSLHAYAKRSFRMPTFNDLYYTDVGNSDLRPESADQYDFGVNYGVQGGKRCGYKFDFKVDAYYNTVHDKIIAYPKGQQFRWTMLNLGRVHITGIDASASAMIVPKKDLSFTARLQYTYQDARDVTDLTTPYYKDQIPYVPYNSGSTIVNATWRGLSLNYSFIYSGERWNEQENIIANHMEPWYTHDVTIQYEIKGKNQSRYRVSLDVNNLFDQKYDVIQNYPMPGRNWALGLQIEL